MRIFDLYEHPTFEIEQADKAEVRSTIRRLGVGVGATVSAIAAISFWYCWSDPSFNRSFLSSAGPTGLRGTYHSILQRGGLWRK